MIIRQAFDEVIDAPRTNRFTLAEIEKTEKTYLGTKIEILFRNYLKIPKGKILDMLIDGVEVDIKNTVGRNWMIPAESIGRPAFVVRADEKKALCDVGLVVFRKEYMTVGKNRDVKKQLAAAHHVNIWWILRMHPYPPNFWEVLPAPKRNEIVTAGSPSAKVAKLFELLQERPISRTQIEAVAQQHDPMRRLRKGGGARDILRKKQIAVLSGIYDQELLKKLGLGPATSEEFISVSPRSPLEEELLRQAGHID
ncbi:NaeI family type II restriction endonuclease [Agrobacterium cavarae]|uniref:NaeI family type II restriction endonuclease n=1 Tax=Agrobacterium cavarae TaxID=2528239 RepID=UPI0028AA049E|nr:NaeI family type II restriction endonuclease [Agrobacterium cavarae]